MLGMFQIALPLLGAVLPVRCVNCGGGNSLSLTIAIVSAVVAIIAAFFAARLYTMQKDEHRVFMRELTRHVQVVITVEPVTHMLPATSEGTARLILRLTFNNNGTKAAHNATVNMLVPESVEHFQRCHEDGSPHPDATPVIRSQQDVPWTQGMSKMLGWKWDVLTTATNRVAFVCISLHPDAECPVRVNLASDDMPPPCQVDYDYTVGGGGNETAQAPQAVPID